MFARFVFFCKFVEDTADHWGVAIRLRGKLSFYGVHTFLCIQPLERIPTHSMKGLLTESGR